MDNSNKGVYFAIEEYAGLIRRTLCLSIDLSFILLLLYLIDYTFDQILEYEFLYGYAIFVWIIFSTLYFSIIKSSKFQTLGYRFLGLKIIDLHGNRPSSLKMIFRFLVSIFGPFEIPFDIIWLIDDTNKQSLRDKFAETYVIKKNAKPIGSNKIVGYYYFINGYSFFFAEVSRENYNLKQI